MGIIANMEKIPVPSLSDEDLMSLRESYRSARLIKEGRPNSLSEETWEEVKQREDALSLPKVLRNFIECQGATARFVRDFTTDRDLAGAKDVIRFLSENGLEKDARAAMVCLREYDQMVENWEDVFSGQMIDALVSFYYDLSIAFREAGIEI